MLQKILIGSLSAVVLSVIAVWAYGSYRWNEETRLIRDRLAASKRDVGAKVFNVQDLENLPAPVQRYFRAALVPGQRMITAASIEHRGTFNMSETSEKWSPFESNQRVIMNRSGFDWNAVISMIPGIPVRVHDAYVAGEGILHAAVFGAITVASIRGTPEAAQGEFMRFVAESAWYPTRMLPSERVQWEAVDNDSARLTMTDGNLSVTLLVRFGADNLISSAKADARARTVGGKIEMTPWQGRFWSYARKDGILYPQQGEVEWLTREGAKPYWRGTVTSIRYEFD
jgi:hypothetical protein